MDIALVRTEHTVLTRNALWAVKCNYKQDCGLIKCSFKRHDVKRKGVVNGYMRRSMNARIRMQDRSYVRLSTA